MNSAIVVYDVMCDSAVCDRQTIRLIAHSWHAFLLCNWCLISRLQCARMDMSTQHYLLNGVTAPLYLSHLNRNFLLVN